MSSPRILILFVAMAHFSEMGQGRPCQRGHGDVNASDAFPKHLTYLYREA